MRKKGRVVLAKEMIFLAYLEDSTIRLFHLHQANPTLREVIILARKGSLQFLKQRKTLFGSELLGTLLQGHFFPYIERYIPALWGQEEPAATRLTET